MSFTQKDIEIYREDEKSRHRKLGVEEREELVKVGLDTFFVWAPSQLRTRKPCSQLEANIACQSYLPTPSSSSRQRSNSRVKTRDLSRFGVRRFLKAQLYAFLYLFIHAIFSLYIRIRIAYHAVSNRLVAILKHHYNSPEYIARDVATLERLPVHLSIILTLENGGKGDALEKLVNEVSEVAAWCTAAGIPKLSVYEKTGTTFFLIHQLYCSSLTRIV